MITLDEIKKKYRTARYVPSLDCPRCKGKGEYIRTKRKLLFPCVCIFFGSDHKLNKFICDGIAKTVKSIKENPEEIKRISGIAGKLFDTLKPKGNPK